MSGSSNTWAQVSAGCIPRIHFQFLWKLFDCMQCTTHCMFLKRSLLVNIGGCGRRTIQIIGLKVGDTCSGSCGRDVAVSRTIQPNCAVNHQAWLSMWHRERRQDEGKWQPAACWATLTTFTQQLLKGAGLTTWYSCTKQTLLVWEGKAEKKLYQASKLYQFTYWMIFQSFSNLSRCPHTWPSFIVPVCSQVNVCHTIIELPFIHHLLFLF